MQQEANLGNLVNLVEIKDPTMGVECIQCTRWFKNQAQLKSHMWKHTGEKPFPCIVCNRRFTQQGNLKAHMRIHTGEKPFFCSEPGCNARFTQRSNLKAHNKIHTGEKPYKCNICNAAFRQQTNLRTHLAIHTGERPFKCEICQKTFTQKSNLKAHRDRVHRAYKKSNEPIRHLNIDHMQNNGLYNNLNIMIAKDGSDGFEIPTENEIIVETDHSMDFSMEPTVEILIPDACIIKNEQFEFSSEKDDYGHMEMGMPYCKEEPDMRIEIVEGNIEDPYSCQICNNTYLSAADLRIHRCSKGLRYFECDLCKDWMHTLTDLKSHQASHSEGKRYTCCLCGLMFSNRPRLKQHHRLHRKMNGVATAGKGGSGVINSTFLSNEVSKLWKTKNSTLLTRKRRRSASRGTTAPLKVVLPNRYRTSTGRCVGSSRERRMRRSKTSLSQHYAVSYQHFLMLQRKFLLDQCLQTPPTEPQYTPNDTDTSGRIANFLPAVSTHYNTTQSDHSSSVTISRRTDPTPLFMCSECKSYFSSLGNIKAHMEMHRQTNAVIKKEVMDLNSQNVFVISACLKYDEPVAQFSRAE